MAEVTAALVKELREKTGAGMMDCKKALNQTDGDLEAAVDWLRKAGLAAVAKKAGRVAAEGLVAVAAAGTRGAVIEVNAETDFVARNEQFQAFVRAAAQIALEMGGDMEAIIAARLPSGATVGEELSTLVATIGENMTLRRAAGISVDKGVVSSYVHNATGEGLGRIGVLVGLESEGDPEKLAAFGRQLAMHVAAAAPQWTDVSEVSADALDRERAILSEQARASGKPDDIIAKMVEGRLRKFYEEVVLLDQVFVIDGESRVREGIERKQADFAAEVAAAAKG